MGEINGDWYAGNSIGDVLNSMVIKLGNMWYN